MKEKTIAGLTVKPDISIGNILVALSMLATVTAFGFSLENDIRHNRSLIGQNAKAIEEGILPEAKVRIAMIETQVKLEFRAMRAEIVSLRADIRDLKDIINANNRGGND